MNDTSRREATQFAKELAEAAIAAAGGRPPFEIRLVRLSNQVYERWERMRMSLSNQVRVGAHGHVLQVNRSRWLYTTTRGRAQTRTLQRWTSKPVVVLSGRTYQELLERLEESLLEAMAKATTDGRQRRVTARGFNLEAAMSRREQLLRFEEIALGLQRLELDEVDRFLHWWSREIGEELQIKHGGLPVPHDVALAAREAGAVLPVVVIDDEAAADTLEVEWAGGGTTDAAQGRRKLFDDVEPTEAT